MKSFAEIVAIVEGAKQGSGFRAKCRAHGGDDPDTLSLTEGDDGRTLFRCFKGCEVDAILRAYGLEWADVLPEREKKRQASKTWEIRDASGTLIAEHTRVDDSGGKKRFFWRRNGESGLGGLPASELPLYLAEKAGSYDREKAVFVCEGEKAADAVVKLGLNALGTVCGASAVPCGKSLEVLDDRRVILWPDLDEPGIEHMRKVEEYARETAREVLWLHQPRAKAKYDAADFTGTLEELRESVRPYPPEINGPLVMLGSRVDAALGALHRLHIGDFSDFIPSGIRSLDQRLGGGLQRGQVILIGAPTGAGKTTLVVQLAMAAQERGLAMLVSPEMSSQELVTREIVRRSGKPKWHRSPWMLERLREEARIAHDAAALELRLNPPKVAVYDSIDVNLDDVQRVAEDRHRRNALSFIALDYAQQLADATSDRARHLLVGEVGHRAVEMARAFNVPVVVTSQVNVFKDGREKEYSFRESQILEHKAHLVMLFLVERDSQGKVTGASFKARKARDLALFELEVEFDPATFTIREKEKAPPPVVRDHVARDHVARDHVARDHVARDRANGEERMLGFGLDG